MSQKTTSNRWIPFQCPACFALFRLRRSQVGRTGRCPTCAAAVLTAEDSLLSSPEPVGGEPPKEELLEKLAVAREMTPEEREAEELRQRNRKRQYTGGEQKGGWVDEESGASGLKVSWQAWLSGIMALVILSALGIFYIVNKRDSDKDDSGLVLGEEYDEFFVKPKAVPEKEASPEEQKTEEEMVDLIDRYRNYDLERLREAVRGFLTAATVDEKKRFVRDAGRVHPLMDDFYAKEDYEPEGFESINLTEVTYRRNLVLTTVQTGDFLNRAISVERVVEEGEETYRPDWESWVAYCEFTPEEMRAQKPTEPFLVRARVGPGDYYNYGFSDDQKWRAYELEMNNGEFLFQGYVPREGELDKSLSFVRRNPALEPFVLKVVYPPGARAKDQVEIVEIVPSDGWVFVNEKEETDE